MTPETQSAPPAEHGPVVARREISTRAKWISAIVVVIVLAVALVMIFGLAGGDKTTPGGPGGRRGGPASTVGVAKATAGDVPITIESLGTVTPMAEVTVRPQVSGLITLINFREGQIVRKGDLLAIIDPRAYRAQLLQAQGALQRDRAQLEVARLTLRRYQTLLAQDSIARQDVDTQAATVRQLEGTANVNRGAVDAAQVNVGFTRIVSPVTGRVGLRVVDVGNYIAAGESTGLVVITTLAPIDVEFTIPQDQLPTLQERIASGEALPAVAMDRTRTATLDTGRFLSLNNQVATDTGTVRAKARFANAGNALYPSQFVNLRLNVSTLRNAVTVPSTAVRQGTSGSYVWLLKADDTVTQLKVTTGPELNDRVTISTGLAVGESVITEGGDRLTEGGKVQTAATAAKATTRTRKQR